MMELEIWQTEWIEALSHYHDQHMLESLMKFRQKERSSHVDEGNKISDVIV